MGRKFLYLYLFMISFSPQLRGPFRLCLPPFCTPLLLALTHAVRQHGFVALKRSEAYECTSTTTSRYPKS